MKAWHTGANRVTGDLGAGPLDGIRDRCVGQHAKVVGQVSVLPNVLGIDDKVPSKSLLKASVELVTPAGPQRNRETWITLNCGHKIIDYCVIATRAREDQVFVERRL